MKRCSRCKVEKPLEDYAKHSKAKDGRQAYCRQCSQQYTREWEALNAERLAARRERALAEAAQQRAEPDPVRTKVCRRCGTEKPLLEFYAHRSTRDRRAAYCKDCAKEYDRTIRREARREYMKTYSATNGPRMRAHMRAFRLRLYGLTREMYEQMVEAQGGRCAICGGVTETVDERPALVVDHDHETNRVRGLLCANCNAGLGMFGDSAERLRLAAAYLEHYRMEMK